MRNVRNLSIGGLLTAMLVSAAPAAAQSGDTITVDQDGSGDYDTIAAAIAAVADGDIILVSPGSYPEAIAIEKDITIAGAGAREDVVIAPGPDEVARVHDRGAAALYSRDAIASVEHLMVTVQPGSGDVAWIDGGAVTFDDVALHGDAVVLAGGEPTFRESVIDAYFAVRDGASPTVEDSEIIGHASVDGPGQTVIRDSILRGGSSASAKATGEYVDNHFIGGQLAVDTGSDMLVRDNLVEGVADGAGILVVDAGSTAQIEDNTVRDSRIGISVRSNEPGTSIRGNHISDVRVGIRVNSDAEVQVTDNTIDSATDAAFVLRGDGAAVVDNRLCGSGVAFDVGGGDPHILGNDICAALE